MSQHRLTNVTKSGVWRVGSALVGVVAMVAVMAVTGSSASAKTPASQWDVAAAVTPTPADGLPTDPSALSKLSPLSAGSAVTPGDTLTYVLKVAPISSGDPGEQVTVVDDISGLLANATMTSTAAQLKANDLRLAGGTLTWTPLRAIADGYHATVAFEVTVKPGAVAGAALTTTARADGGATCKPGDDCATSLTVKSAATTAQTTPASTSSKPSPRPAPKALAAKPNSQPGGPSPLVVPSPGVNSSVVTVKVGGDRTGVTGVTPLPGVTLGLYAAQTGGTALFTCVSDADGDCNFTVDATGPGGANRNKQYWVRQTTTGVPAGWFVNQTLRTGDSNGTTNAATPYAFQTPALLGNNTYSSTATGANGFMLSSGNVANASGGIWQQSRTNPTLPAECGLKVALVLDLSGSVGQTGNLANLKAAADTFTNSLVGTPSSMALFSFSEVSPASGATQNYPTLTPVSTQAQADAFKARYASWTSGGGTNWDRGLAVAAAQAAGYGVVVVITDGNPTRYNDPPEGPSSSGRLREMENAIFSANEVKHAGARVIAFGVGSGVTSPITANNLAAISGPTKYNGSNPATADYYQTTDYTAAGNALRTLALGNCAGTVTVVKQVVPFTAPAGTTTGAQPAGGWTFGGAATASVTVAPGSGVTAAGTGALNFNLGFPGGTLSTNFTGTETQQAGYTLQQVGTKNAVCTNLATNTPVTVTNATLGFTVPVGATDAISCTVYNRAPAPQAVITLHKTWIINGQTFVDGAQPSAFFAQATLTGPGGAGATNQGWGVTRGGYSVGNTAVVNETTTITGPTLCTVASSNVTAVNGTTLGTPAALPYTAALSAPSNDVTVTNTITCATHLTLVKQVVNGPAVPVSWTLSAIPPSGTTLSGPTGAPAITNAPVTPNVTYQLAESGGDPRYVQDDERTNLQTNPLSTGSMTCVQIDASGNVIPGYSDGINGGVSVPLGYSVRCTAINRTAPLILIKHVVNDNGGTAVPGDWNLTATPTAPPTIPAGLSPQTVPGSTAGQAIFVRPGQPYDLTESALPGYTLTSIQCVTSSNATPRSLTSITLAVGESGVCTYTNNDQPAHLTLVKTVTNDNGGTAAATAWTLTAAGTTTTISGATGTAAVTNAPVNAGTYTLSESGGPGGYTAGSWLCTAGTLTGSSLVLPVGTSATCTVNNNDQPAHLTLIKTVTNNNGGTAVPTDWTLTATGPTTITGATGSASVTNAQVNAGTYTLSESGPGGYAAGDWSCTAGTLTGSSLVLPLNTSATCTINNNDETAHLTLVKVVDAAASGSGKVPADWTLTATPVAITGQPTVSGNGDPTSAGGVNQVSVFSGSYTLTESGPDGFTAGNWVCEGAVFDGSTVAVPNGGNVVCEITNTAVTPTLTLIKVVDNHQTGATTLPTAWILSADGPTPISGKTGDPSITGAPVKVGTYTLSESGPSGYDASDWVCTGGASTTVTSVTLAEGQNATCTITNRAIVPLLTLRKVVDNGTSGATKTPADFTLTAVNGTSTISGPGNSAAVTDQPAIVGTYALSETTLPGYTASDWVCTGGAPATPTSVPIAVGDDVTCTITNTAAAPSWTLAKTADPTSGTQVNPGDTIDYTLTATNTGQLPLVGATATDDLTNVLPFANLGTLPPELTESGNTLTWAVPTVGVDGTAKVTFSVTVKANAYGITVHNLATPTSPGGECVSEAGCATDHPTPPRWVLNKTANPPSGTTVAPGSTIAYTLTATNIAEGPLLRATATDDLSAVLPYADVVTPLPAGLAQSGSTLTWTLPTLAVGESTTVTFSVTVHDDAHGVTVHNLATPTSPGGACEPVPVPEVATLALAPAAVRAAADPADVCETVHKTPPTWSLTKSADPKSGTTVAPGSTITYTLTARNTSQAVVSNATATDDLSKVLSAATLVTPLANGLTKSGTTLTWALPDIPVGGVVTVKYAVKVGADALGVTITNLATPTTPGGSCPSASDCTTTHDTPPAWTLKKTADPASGTDVDAGSTITYTLTATNVGKAVVTGAEAKDDLTKVTPFADVLTPLPAGLTRSGNTLTWAIPDIAVGKSVSVTFSVKVHSDASNVTVANHATVGSPGGRCTSCSTHHHVPKQPPLASTGVPVDEYVGWAGLLVLLGGLLLIAGRRRRTS